MQSRIDKIFLQDGFSNVPSNELLKQMHTHISYICEIFSKMIFKCILNALVHFEEKFAYKIFQFSNMPSNILVDQFHSHRDYNCTDYVLSVSSNDYQTIQKEKDASC